MIERLRAGERKDALSMGMLIATEVLTESQERNWLERKLDMLYSELEHTWGYQKILEKGRTEGLHEGEQRGILKGEQKGRLEGLSEGLQERLFTIVELRFPELLSDAQQAVPQITDPDLLRQVGDQLRIISKLEEARRLLLSTSKNQRMPSEQN
jgi:flagellar biosynthesis/type III secretory pathway protein FliH